MRVLRAVALAGAALLGAAPGATAQQRCDGAHEVTGGETLVSIAETIYGDAEKWPLIFYANRDIIPEATLAVAPGQRLTVPCLPEPQPAASPAAPQGPPELTLVTLRGFAPFSDPDWPGEGLATEIVREALRASPEPTRFEISWQTGAGALAPLLAEKRFDMGFPVTRPDCEAAPIPEDCAAFHFSDPLFDVITVLFVRAGSGLRYDSDADLEGLTLCRPEGQAVHDLDAAGRNLVRDGRVTVARARDEAACFEMLMQARTDAVAINIFTGAQVLAGMGLRGQIVPLERPLSTQSLHLMISKLHWRGTTHLYRVNAGLRALKAGPRYGEIVTRHLATFWDRLQND